MTLQKLDLSSNNFDIEDISKLKNHIGRRSNIINIDLDN